ncbi:transposase [Nonomuraea sp. NPDC026600]|uniref:transposase n=1 Tax=Nonomuraea sp. NPDC026600 TaxID=3155363 RepID=UPI0033E67199
MTSHPDHVTADDKTKLEKILERSPRLAALSAHVTAFAQMMTNRTGSEHLKNWLAAVEADDIAQLHSFAKGIDRDLDAVINRLTPPARSRVTPRRSRPSNAADKAAPTSILCSRQGRDHAQSQRYTLCARATFTWPRT